MSPTGTKEQAHLMIDLMSPEELAKAVNVLKGFVDPVALAQANAPFEDEEISEEEELAVARAKSETGPTTSMEELLAEYGVALEELEGIGAMSQSEAHDPSTVSHAQFIAEFGLSADDWERLGGTPLELAE